MFVDKVMIKVKAGDGGNGAISFLREKYRPNGGPAGGDGGRGGSIFFVADSGINTLFDFKYNKKLTANSGENGGKKHCSGKSAKDIYVKVPLGTIIKNIQTGVIIADFNSNQKVVLIAKGGRGGRGNAHFASSTNKAPRIAENGVPGEEKELLMELKLIADVGLIGFPSVGKSSILSAVSNAKVEVASYHFTTLIPQLGVVNIGDYQNFVLADLPGLIEGASSGKGLGIEFLRHIERCRVLIHVIDIAATEHRDPYQDFLMIMNELKTYNLDLLSRPMIIALNKIDVEDSSLMIEDFKARIDSKYPLFLISALTHQGLSDLMYASHQLLLKTPKLPDLDNQFDKEAIYDLDQVEVDFIISRPKENLWIVSGSRIERIYQKINLSMDQGLMFLQSILREMGVEKALREKGIREGDIVRIVDFDFEYFE